jgi:hypothetical protein
MKAKSEANKEAKATGDAELVLWDGREHGLLVRVNTHTWYSHCLYIHVPWLEL